MTGWSITHEESENYFPITYTRKDEEVCRKWCPWEAWWYDLRQVRHLRDQLHRALGCLLARPHFNVTHQLCCTVFLFDVWLHCCDSRAVDIPQTCSWYQKSTGARSHVLFVSFPSLTSLFGLTTTTAGSTLSHSYACFVYKEHRSHPACTHQKQELCDYNDCAAWLSPDTCLVWDQGQGTGLSVWLMEYLVYVQSLQYAWENLCRLGHPKELLVTRRKQYACADGNNTENRNRLRSDLII